MHLLLRYIDDTKIEPKFETVKEVKVNTVRYVLRLCFESSVHMLVCHDHKSWPRVLVSVEDLKQYIDSYLYSLQNQD